MKRLVAVLMCAVGWHERWDYFRADSGFPDRTTIGCGLYCPRCGRCVSFHVDRKAVR